ncbi:Imm41 family immunity protein [Salinimonas iocasae]|uniref:Uncharacterized protein n=1 Tax=Salinimonas iocasae TaxID=2572577 RepID=A0A5B7YJD1_9ALTE|nr:Imm41 family immunity protein [Salinimonas iocasae]QCZ94669.1 hypothetical protein FBQ74_14865 [Salinimonas iocasae]
MNQLNRNFVLSKEFSENSFISIFHESQTWNDVEYFKLENYLYEECEKHLSVSVIPREVLWPAIRIYSYLSNAIGCHLDPNDGFEIIGISQKQLYQRRERLQLVFEGFFQGEMPAKKYIGY